LLLLLGAALLRRDQRCGQRVVVSPEDGATVESPFQVSAEAEGFTLEPAGDVRNGAGHLHLIVDTSCVAAGAPIREDQAHVHLDDGASETELELPAGEHTLCLQSGNGEHTAPDLTDEITITVAGVGGTTTDEDATAEGEVEEWKGTYRGSVVWDCGPIGTRRGTLRANFTIGVDADRTATMKGPHIVTGSCQGSEGSLTTPITVTGKRTASGFTSPSTLWGPPGSLTIAVTGDHGAGTLTGRDRTN
jgi:hypothetical protein